MRMSYSKDRKRFEVFTSYEEYRAGHVDRVKSARFRFTKDPITCWWTEDAKKAALLISCADDETREMISPISKAQVESIDLSKAHDADVSVPLEELGVEPFPFQRAGIAYALKRDRVMFGDEPGLGKTLQVLSTVHFRAAYPCVAVVPASLKINWKKEAQRIVPELRDDDSIQIISGRAKKGDRIDLKAKLVIVNYDILASWVDAIQEIKPKSLIADESHFWKNDKAARTKAGKLLASTIPQRYLLSGTALVNRPKELLSQLDILGVLHEFGGSWGFLQRFCGAKKQRVPIPGRGWTSVWNFDGSSNTDELQRKLRTNVMVRRLKQDVLTELPAKTHQCIELACNGLRSFVDLEYELEHEFEREKERLEHEKQVALDSGNQESFEDASKQLKRIFEAHFSEMAKLAHDVAVAKLPKVIEYCLEVLEGEEKLAVFAHHHDVVFALEKAFKDAGIEAVRLTGMDSPKDKDAAVESFQNGSARVFIGSLKAAGVGLTLTKARRAVFAELDWTPGVMDQAGDRLHRIGQTDNVLLTYIVLEDSLDSKKVGMLVDKRRVLNAVLDKALIDYNVPSGDPVQEQEKPDFPPCHVFSIIQRLGITENQIPF
jgi:SWI/SNF-related matrix-associated actin-dependent regulator 1 of chromatin subfamily A